MPTTRQVMQRSVPFVGAFCNGEIGPRIRAGYVGWSFTEQAAACLDSAQPRPARDSVALQSYTSVYSVLG